MFRPIVHERKYLMDYKHDYVITMLGHLLEHTTIFCTSQVLSWANAQNSQQKHTNYEELCHQPFPSMSCVLSKWTTQCRNYWAFLLLQSKGVSKHRENIWKCFLRVRKGHVKHGKLWNFTNFPVMECLGKALLSENEQAKKFNVEKPTDKSENQLIPVNK